MDASSVASDDDYDVISNPGLESSIADLMSASQIYEPRPSEAARKKLSTVELSAEEIQLYVRQHCHAEPRLIRVYVDGIFDGLSAGLALQLRQAKLSFPAVHLMVGVFSDEECQVHGSMPSAPHVERCELVRHCRWVDEIVEDALWQTNEHFLRQRHIDFIAVEEGLTVDPKCDKVRLRGYDSLKKLGKTIPTRRTLGLARPRLLSVTTPVAATPIAATPIAASPTVPSISIPEPDFTDQYGIGY